MNKLLNSVLAVALASFGLLAQSCGSSDSSGQLEFQNQGLESLGDGYVYEAWLIVDDAPISAGRFSLSSADEVVVLEENADQASLASTFVLTIEPAQNDDPAPAMTHVLAGDFSGDRANLTAGHGAALGSDYLDALGGYILETPSTANVADDYHQGVWWLDPTGPAASLTLAALPLGWQYEGWAVTQDGPVSTGRFTQVGQADSDNAGPTAGSDGSPPFPGQDFIDPAVTLIGATVVISIEPDPDDGAGPFAFKPLVDEVEDTGAGTSQSMSNNAVAFPKASVIIR